MPLGFGEGICQWIESFYRNIKSAVIVNGQICEWFTVQRGCRQGDPISPYLFVLCVEILAIMIRENKEIKGITVNKVNHKISQFADDTQLLNEGDRQSFEISMKLLKIFGNSSGLRLNTEKNRSYMGRQLKKTLTQSTHQTSTLSGTPNYSKY